MVKIFNIDDPHVDVTSVGGYDQKRGMHSNWVESFGRLNEVIDAANAAKADFITIGGDLFDTGKPTAEAVALTTDAFRRAKPHIVIVDGNHDQQTVVDNHRTPIAAYFGSMKNITTASSPTVVEIDGVQFALAPWLRVSGKSKLENISDELKRTVEGLSEQIKSGPSMFVGHLVVDECTFDNGMARGSEIGMTTAMLEAHVPTRLLDDGAWSLARLGHIHKRQQLSKKTGYGGSIYKVSFGEYREDKGYDIIEIDEKNNHTLEFGKLNVRNLMKIDLSSEGQDSITEVEKAREGDIVRIVVDHDGADSLDIKNVRSKLNQLGIDNHVNKLPKPRREALRRISGASVDTDPKSALELYLDRQDVTDKEERELLLEDFNSIMQDIGGKR